MRLPCEPPLSLQQHLAVQPDAVFRRPAFLAFHDFFSWKKKVWSSVCPGLANRFLPVSAAESTARARWVGLEEAMPARGKVLPVGAGPSRGRGG